MNPISGIGSVVSRMRELENNVPRPSIADVVGNPNVGGPETPAVSEFTDKYEMAALANTLRANADMQLALIQMIDPRSPTR